MEFTYFEYFLIIFSSAFIIFSLAIRSESNRKYFEFLGSLESLKTYINQLVEKKEINIPKDKVKGLCDTIDSRGELFKWCLTKVNSYVYHSFYTVFFFSCLGLAITLIYDLDLFNIYSTFSQQLDFLLLFIHLISVILFYWYSRAVFVLILYTKIDYEYLEKLAKKIDDIINYSQLYQLDGEKTNFWSGLRIFFLKYFLFPIFFIFNTQFKEFFYKYYSL